MQMLSSRRHATPTVARLAPERIFLRSGADGSAPRSMGRKGSPTQQYREYVAG